jgi:hypothetical protein
MGLSISAVIVWSALTLFHIHELPGATQHPLRSFMWLCIRILTHHLCLLNRGLPAFAQSTKPSDSSVGAGGQTDSSRTQYAISFPLHYRDTLPLSQSMTSVLGVDIPFVRCLNFTFPPLALPKVILLFSAIIFHGGISSTYVDDLHGHQWPYKFNGMKGNLRT